MLQPSAILKWYMPYVLITSFQFQIGKDVLNYSSPFPFMAIRYLIAGAMLILISRKLFVSWGIFLISMLTAGSTLFWIEGLRYVSPGDSAVLNYSMPLFAIPLAIIILNERPTGREIAGTLLGFFGVVVYSLTLVHGSVILGIILTLVAAILGAGFTVLFRKMRNRDAASLVGSQFLIGSIPFLFGSLIYPQISFDQRLLVDLAYLAILGGAVQFFLWNAMLKIEKVGKVTTMAFAVPVSSMVVQVAETSRLPTLVAVIGACFMFAGIFLANSKEKGSQAQIGATQSPSLAGKRANK